MCPKYCMNLLLCFLFRIFGNEGADSSIHNFDNGSNVSHYVFLLDKVQFTCPFATIYHIYSWTHGKSVINLGMYIIGHRFKNNIEVFENSSILIKSVSLSDEGFYSCRNNSTILAVHSLTVNDHLQWEQFVLLNLHRSEGPFEEILMRMTKKYYPVRLCCATHFASQFKYSSI